MKNKPTKKAPKKERQNSPKKKSEQISFWQDKTNLLYLAIALGITAIVFSGSLQNGFVNWDDEANLLENPNMAALNAHYLKNIFTERVLGGYIPLPILTLAIEHHFFGLNPFIYHFDALILHLISVLLVYRIFIALRLSPVAALIGAMLFGFHPMRVESVAWVTERKDVLFGVFYLSALFLYIKNKTSDNPKFLTNIIIILLFVLALFSKIQAVSLPLTLIVIDFYLDKKLSWKSILNKTPLFLLSLAFGLGGIYFLSEDKTLLGLTQIPLSSRLLVGALSYILYLVKFIFPYRMSPMYPYTPELTIDFYLAPFGVLLIAVFLFYAWKKQWYWLLTGMGIYTVNVVFMLQILGAGQGLFADRYTYIPYLGIMFLVAYGIDYRIKNNPNGMNVIYAVSGVYFAVFAFMTWNQTKIWENGGTLWSHVLKYYPNATTPWQNRARYYRTNKKYDLALADLNAAIALRADLGASYNSRAKINFDLQRYKDAIPDYDSSIVFKSDNGEAYINRGVSHCALGEYDKGIVDIIQGISLNPGGGVLKNGYKNLGLVYSLTGQYQKSLEAYDKLLGMDQYQASIWYEEALCLRHLGKEQEAVKYLNKAIEIGPASGDYYHERAKALYALGDKMKSRSDVVMAVKLGTKVDDYLNEGLK